MTETLTNAFEPMKIVAIVFGLFCFIGAVSFEIKWRLMLRRRQRTNGTVTGEVETHGDGPNPPEIEFSFRGEKRRFVSRYATGNVEIGKPVIVVFDVETGEAEEYSWSNRWYPIIFLAIFGVGCVLVGIFGQVGKQ